VSVVKTGISALGKLVLLGILLTVFMGTMVGVVYVSLNGEEIKVPEIVGKDFVQSEKELASLGLKIKKRAERPSDKPINTVLEQLPKPGDTVKSGQLILVVTSRQFSEGEEPPKSLIKDINEDDTEKIEEMISDKPKKTKSNSNTEKKKADTSRDVIEENSNTKTSSDAADASNTAKPEADKKPTEVFTNKTITVPTPAPKASPKATPKPAADKPGSGEQRPRRTNP
jgi:beta-lactam-binding protein with PASTA domain